MNYNNYERYKDAKFFKFSEEYPVIMKTYPDWKEINPILEKYIREQGDRKNKRTNVKAQMTEWNMQVEAGGEHFQNICDFARELSLENSPVQFIPDVYDCWGAVYRKGEFTQSHDHWPSIWSWCYYVNVSSKCSPLHFKNASGILNEPLNVQPSNGLMVIFPGWVKHEVKPQSCEHERVMIAGNINARGAAF